MKNLWHREIPPRAIPRAHCLAYRNMPYIRRGYLDRKFRDKFCSPVRRSKVAPIDDDGGRRSLDNPRLCDPKFLTLLKFAD